MPLLDETSAFGVLYESCRTFAFAFVIWHVTHLHESHHTCHTHARVTAHFITQHLSESTKTHFFAPHNYIQPVCFSVLQCVAVSCSVLQCVAVCYSVWQFVAACCNALQWVSSHLVKRRHSTSIKTQPFTSHSQIQPACCSVLQHVTVCCSML